MEINKASDSGDLISRQAAIDALKHNQDVYSHNFHDDPIDKYTTAIIAIDIDTLVNLPSAQPPRTGRWRHYEGWLTCSKCGAEYYDDIIEYCGDNVLRFCPDCGADMRGEADADVKS